MEALMDSVDLVSLASILRPTYQGRAIVPDPNEKVLAGGRSIHIPIVFDDGVKWLARIRQQSFNSPPKRFESLMEESEISTQQSMHSPVSRYPLLGLSSLKVGTNDVSFK